MTALAKEWQSAASNVRGRHLARLAELGVPMASLATLGTEQPTIGAQRARFDREGLWEPDPDGEPAVVVAVCESDCFGPVLVDLIAFASDNPKQWAWRNGDGWALGLDNLDDGRPVRVVEDPIAWLACAGDAVCILNWSAPPSCWSRLRESVALDFSNDLLRARCARAMQEAVTLPAMGVFDDVA